MITGNIVAACIALVLSLVTYLLADVFPPIVDDAPGPGFVPKILAGAMTVLALALLAQTAVMRSRRRQAEAALGHAPETNDPSFTSPGVRLSYTLALVCIGYAILIATVGFVIASLLFIPLGMWLLGERNYRNMGLVAAGTVGAFYFLFVYMFNMPLPGGMLW